MHIAICDDEKSCQDTVTYLLQQFMATKNISYSFKCFHSGEGLLTACEANERFDLIFLDVFMGDLDGMATAKALREKGITSEIVFLTTSPDFAVESYQVSALSYLLKPFLDKNFYKVMDRFLRNFHPEKLQIGETIFSVSDLVYAESLDKKIILHFLDKSTQVVQGKFEEITTKLHYPNFLHCHRCYIVNLNHVKKIEDGYFLTVTDEQVLIRQKEFTAIKKLYYKYVLSS